MCGGSPQMPPPTPPPAPTPPTVTPITPVTEGPPGGTIIRSAAAAGPAPGLGDTTGKATAKTLLGQ